MKCKLANQAIQLDYTHTYADLAEPWHKMIPDTEFLNPKNVGLEEKSKLNNLEYYYVTIHKNNQLVGFMYFQKLKIKTTDISVKNSRLNVLTNSVINCFQPNLLVFGDLFRHDIKAIYFVDHKMTIHEQCRVLYEAIREMQNMTKTSAVVLKDIPVEYDYYFLHEAKKCKPMKKDIVMKMKIPSTWMTFDDYLNALKHKYKQRAKKIRKNLEFIEYREMGVEDMVKYQNEINTCYEDIVSKQLVKLGRINASYLIQLKNSNAQFKFFGIFEKVSDRFLGFFSSFDKADEYDMFYIGFGEEDNRNYGIYFNILYWAVELAIVHCASVLNLGRTAIDAKAVVGCEPFYTQNFYTVRNPLLSFGSQLIQDNFNKRQGEVWEFRHPFNESYYNEVNVDSMKDHQSVTGNTISKYL